MRPIPSVIEQRYKEISKNRIFFKMNTRPIFSLNDSFRLHLCPVDEDIILVFTLSLDEFLFSDVLFNHGYKLCSELESVIDTHFLRLKEESILLKSIVKEVNVFQIELFLKFDKYNELSSCHLNIIIYIDGVIQKYEVTLNINNFSECHYSYLSTNMNNQFEQKNVSGHLLSQCFVIEYVKQQLILLKLTKDINIESITMESVPDYLHLISMHTI